MLSIAAVSCSPLCSPMHDVSSAQLTASLPPPSHPGGLQQALCAAPFQPFLPDTALRFAIQAEQRQVSPCIGRHKNATATARAALRAFSSTQMQQQQSPKERVLLGTCVLPTQPTLLTFCTVMTASWVLLSVVTLNISTPSSSFT